MAGLDTVPDALAAQVRMLCMDVDGVLTDGRLYYGSEGEAYKVFDVLDGHGLVALRHAGYQLAILSGRGGDKSGGRMVQRRAAELGIAEVHVELKDKRTVLLSMLERVDIRAEQVCYVGDDIPDIGPMQVVGLPLTVPAAPAQVQAVALASTRAQGGRGAVREICDLLLAARDGTGADAGS
ncbi:MAG: KdsC family phosphatase [Gammaproteobacteria bacterium]